MTNLATILAQLGAAAAETADITTPFAVEPANPKFGADFAIACFKTAADRQQNPTELAQTIASRLQHSAIAKTEAMGGFVNIWLQDDVIVTAALTAAVTKPVLYANKKIVTEYSDPNPFKALHAGHLYTTVVGDVISRLIAAAGGNVHRVNFGGDVGPHVARAMWSITREGQENAWQKVQAMEPKSLHERAVWIASEYTRGNTAFDDSPVAKEQIMAMNKKVYQLHETGDHDSLLAKIYWTCRDWSYKYFDAFYEELGVEPFEKYYPESATAPEGISIVREQLATGVYEESNGAIVFNGEKHGLHTRVFINSQGLPTYEAKDVGLIMKKWREYSFDKSIIITANDIVEYMKVVLKSIEQFEPELVRRSLHLTHGLIKLEGGKKMSSRKGNVLYGSDILQAAEAATSELNGGKASTATAHAAVKYAFLKQRIGGDIVYDPKESVSLQGSSGPYLQYAHARACSILAKVGAPATAEGGLQPGERQLARKIADYPAAVAKAVEELMPHHICTYLYELAQEFNRFYEKNRVLGDPRQDTRLHLLTAYRDVLADGLGLLGIAAPEKI